ncbi:MAG TPA: NAD(P)/FAD-dependent oxidoreductase [Chitinophagaceae bacterium]|nr:NAD(P)/FAD-dependent oxidoreductase [Chitinophagaceae bacterium]
MSTQLIVIGGGAAGFFCAINAALHDPSLKIIILEKSSKLLSKVKVSGGGRCNVTHACFDIAEMSRRYPRGEHFIRKAFHRFFTTDTIQWFEERGVKLKTEGDGRMFPVTDSSQTIIDCLLRDVSKQGIEIRMNAEVIKVEQKAGKFQIELTNAPPLTADLVCIASGGYPKSSLFEWIQHLGHSIESPVPSLFTFNLPQHPLAKLMGVSVENVAVKIAGSKLSQEGPLLITHWGLSGPAILKLSAWGARELQEKNWKFTAIINWLPGLNEQHVRDYFQQQRSERAAQKVNGKNNFGLPARLWEFLALQSGVANEMRWADLPSAVQNRLIKNLCNYECEVKGKTTFKEEFVTAGGIKLVEIDPNTMMSKKVPGLFFAGEVMDVDGITGGYNFQHAWTSGWIAAKSIGSISPKAI